MLIRVHVAIAKNSIPYFDYLKANYGSLCSSNSKLEFYAYSMEGTLPVKCDKFIVCPNGRGSTGHATTLQVILNEPITEDVRIIADSDTVMLKRDWDLHLKGVFSLYQGYKMIGPMGQRIGARDTGNGPRHNYKHKPTLIWCATTKDVDLSKLDVMPNKAVDLPVDSVEKSLLWNLPIGKSLLRDVAWQTPEFLEKNKIMYVAMDNFQPSDPQAIALRGATDYNEEYQLWGTPFVAHQRGSNYHTFRSSPESKLFYDAVERYIAGQR